MPLIALHTLDTALQKQCRQGSKSCRTLFFEEVRYALQST